MPQTREIQLILEPIIQRLQRLESQESLIQQFYKQYADGSFYIAFSGDEQGLSDQYIPDFVMPKGTLKLGTRGIRVFDAGNPGQILGGRYAASGFPNGGGYIPTNQSSGANETQFHISGWDTVYTPVFDPVFGVGPGIFEGELARISFYTDEIPFLGDHPGSIVFQTVKDGTSGRNVDESSYMWNSADWAIGDHTRFGAAGVYSDGNWVKGIGRFNIYAGGPVHNEAIGLTVVNALKAVIGTNGAGITQQFMFKDSIATDRPAVRFRISKGADYMSSGNEEALFAIIVQRGGTEHNYFGLNATPTDHRMALTPPNVAAGGGFVINYAALAAWAATYKYIVVDPATGNLAVSAIGPAS